MSTDQAGEQGRAPEIKLLTPSKPPRASGWTTERRQRQSEAIRAWRPWEKSTGPRTAEGKAKVGRNWITPTMRMNWLVNQIADDLMAELDFCLLGREATTEDWRKWAVRDERIGRNEEELVNLSARLKAR